MTRKMILLIAIIFSAGPLDEISSARAAYDAMPPERQRSALFVSMLGARNPADVEVAHDLAVNGVVFRRQFVHLTPVVGKSKTLYRLDLEDLAWPDAEARKLIAADPYFQPFQKNDPYPVPVVRADWLVVETTTAARYYALLGFGKTLDELFKRIGFNAKSPAIVISRHGARVGKSGVSTSRSVERSGDSPFGHVWKTQDTTKVADRNPAENIDQLTYKEEASELFGRNPNGLFWWALANAKGELQAAAPIAIAQDRREFVPLTKLKDCTRERVSEEVLEVQSPQSCLGCHAKGLRSAPDFVSGIIGGNALDVRAYDKKTSNKIADFFDARAQADSMAADSLGYQKAVERCTGKPSLEAGNIFAKVRYFYSEERVTLEQAARELNVSEEEFKRCAKVGDDVRLAVAYWFINRGDVANARAVLGIVKDEAFNAFLAGQRDGIALGSDTLRSLVGGATIERKNWEAIAYPESTILVCYQQPARADLTRAMVRERFKPVEQLQPTQPKQPPAKVNVEAPKPQTLIDRDGQTGRPIESTDGGKTWRFVK